MVQNAWIKAIRTRAAIKPRTMYKRVSERSKKESRVSLALGSEVLLSKRRENTDYPKNTYYIFKFLHSKASKSRYWGSTVREPTRPVAI